MREFRAPDGVTWRVDVTLPSHSGGMLVFRHPSVHSSAGDRYAWINAPVAKTADPRERLSAETLLESLSESEVARLFRRSMPVSGNRHWGTWTRKLGIDPSPATVIPGEATKSGSESN